MKMVNPQNVPEVTAESCVRHDVSRCARLRSGCETCSRCVEACTTGAITLDKSIQIDAELCTECGCCTAVCPTGALHWEPPLGFGRMLARAGSTQVTLGCSRIRSCDHLESGGCLGWLAEEHLCALAAAAKSSIQLDLTHCPECPNCQVPGILRDRVESAERGSGLPIRERIHLVTECDELRNPSGGLARRQFFTMWKESAVPEPKGFPNIDFRVRSYGDKELSAKQKLAMWATQQCDHAVQARMAVHFEGQVEILAHCDGCDECVAVCPSGALHEQDGEQKPTFLPSCCTRCGACEGFCDTGAIRVDAFGESGREAAHVEYRGPERLTINREEMLAGHGTAAGN